MLDTLASDAYLAIEQGNYYLMTHATRRENVHVKSSLEAILAAVHRSTSRRATARKQLDAYVSALHVIVVDPIEEMLVLMANAKGVITDSGTVVEEDVPWRPIGADAQGHQRPQVYDCRSSVKRARAEEYPANEIFAKVEYLAGTTWEHGLGDGKTSRRRRRSRAPRP